ncbi:acetylxylan esterase [Clostridium sp. FP2]|uniref:alpha/beta hydrolase family protein n=1 Tax=Clostridium sp. FP2 TaxID=2724481 RepID=UPI0013E96758|nr:acetylxylan esterase [Clostridium sp. FP2]MBZ9623676.1 acetylxylan esterase [Clostridium sp. FP2]
MSTNSKEMVKLIDLKPVSSRIDYGVLETFQCNGYRRELIEYFIHGRKNTALLLLPDGEGKHPAVLINHQHNRERNLGKSEVCGLAGNPLQAFGPALAERGFVVIAPDSLCFEDRRVNASGINKNDEDDDCQHFLTMCYGILTGQTLAKIVIEDAIGAISVLNGLDCVDYNKIGCLGHSYGGNTTIYLTAFDKRIHYACASGSAATFRNRIKNNVGIEMASVIPNFMRYYDIDDVVCEICPTKFLIVSATEDKYSKDAMDIYKKAQKEYKKCNAGQQISIKQYEGGHALTSERFNYIVDWIIEAAK